MSILPGGGDLFALEVPLGADTGPQHGDGQLVGGARGGRPQVGLDNPGVLLVDEAEAVEAGQVALGLSFQALRIENLQRNFYEIRELSLT